MPHPRGQIVRWAALPVLAGPTVPAFFSGGYFDESRLWTGAAAWVLVAVLALAGERPWRPPLLVGALAAFSAWTALSILWAPIAGPAVDGIQRALLYLAALGAAVAVLRDPAVRRAAEPALLAGIALVALYALAERLVPGLDYTAGVAAGDRLNQPLTYWNALGALCAIGLVLAAGLVASERRTLPLREAAAATAAPLGLAVYLTFSRGALGAAAAGLALLVVLSPSWRTVRAVATVAAAAALPALATFALPGVEATTGGTADGLAMLALLALTAAAAAWLARGAAPPSAVPRLRTAALAVLAVALVVSIAATIRTDQRSAAPTGATAQRLVSAQSNRYEYWKAAVATFADHPVAGVGSGGFAVEWLRRRQIDESVRDAHSLYLETGAELGLVGLLLLGLLIAAAVRCAHGRGPEAAGAVAALAAYALHAGLDWDWEMPALTLVAVVLLARLAAESGRAAPAA